MNSVLRANPEAKAAYYQAGIVGQYLVPNDIRSWEGLNPLPNGDVPVDFQKSDVDDNKNKPAEKNTSGGTKRKTR